MQCQRRVNVYMQVLIRLFFLGRSPFRILSCRRGWCVRQRVDVFDFVRQCLLAMIVDLRQELRASSFLPYLSPPYVSLLFIRG